MIKQSNNTHDFYHVYLNIVAILFEINLPDEANKETDPYVTILKFLKLMRTESVV